MSAQELSDGGGPFGFDITTALEFDYLIEKYNCDAIIETGSNYGDTTHYLARTYHNLTILTCDVVDKYVNLVKRRLADAPNVVVEKANSPDLIAAYKALYAAMRSGEFAFSTTTFGASASRRLTRLTYLSTTSHVKIVRL